MSCRPYQSVLSSDVFAMTTSRRMPSTSYAYHSGNVSLSPTVTSTPYGSTEFNRSAAKSTVSRCPARDADVQFVNRGINARAKTGDVARNARCAGTVNVVRPTLTVSVPINDAADSHTYSSPSAAHTPQAEK